MLKRLWPYLLLGMTIGYFWPGPDRGLWPIQLLSLLLVLVLATALLSGLIRSFQHRNDHDV